MRQKANDLAHSEGISLNHFISLAIAEKVTRMEQTALMNEQTKPSQAKFFRSRLSFERPA